MSGKTLFAPCESFLEHTLAQASAPCPSSLPSLPAVRLGDGTQVTLAAAGVLKIEPALPTARQLIVSAGIHGNETAPIEICDDLVTELLAEHWPAGARTLVILGNPPAIMAGKRFIDCNLNRLFNGIHRQPNHDGSRERARAALLERQVRDFIVPRLPLFHYDLHTAIRDSRRERFALYPFVPGRHLPEDQKQFLLDSAVDTVLHQHAPASTFAAWTATEFLAESFTIELGKVRPFGENDRSRFRGIENSLRQLLQGGWPHPAPSRQANLTEFQVVHEILNTGPSFVFHIPDDTANFTEYPPGTLIWEDASTRYRVGDLPEAIVFPNPQVPLGQRVGLMAVRRRGL